MSEKIIPVESGMEREEDDMELDNPRASVQAVLY
jgi:hypothetical protein